MFYLGIFLWLIMVGVAMVATFLAAIGYPDCSWWSAAFWWAAVIFFYWHVTKNQKEVK